MADTDTEGSALEIWSVTQCPFTIAYSRRVLDDIRLAVVDAFFSLPRGGVEIGGVLLGKVEPGRLSVLDYAPLDCEHALGPSFTLSIQDQTRLEELLERVRKNGPPWQPVGWYHSHTRSEIFLSDADLEIHNRYFPEAWQVALVVRPSALEPARAGFFFRERDGSLHAKASDHEILIDALGVQPAPGGGRAMDPLALRPSMMVEPLVASSPMVIEPPLAAAAAAAETDRGIPLAWDAEPSPAAPSSLERDAASQDDWEPAGDPEPQPADAVPSFAQEQPARPRRLWIAAGLAAVTLGAFAYNGVSRWLLHPNTPRPAASLPASQPPELAFTATDDRGRLQIRWDAHSPAVARARSAVLQIADNGQSVEVPLDASHLYAGGFTYPRHSERVEATLTLEQPAGSPVQATVAFRGPSPAAQAPPPAAPPQQTGEWEKKNAALAKQVAKISEQNTELSQQNADLRKQNNDLVRQATRLKTELAAAADRSKKLEEQADPSRRQQRKRLANQSFFDPLQ